MWGSSQYAGSERIGQLINGRRKTGAYMNPRMEIQFYPVIILITL